MTENPVRLVHRAEMPNMVSTMPFARQNAQVVVLALRDRLAYPDRMEIRDILARQAFPAPQGHPAHLDLWGRLGSRAHLGSPVFPVH